MLKSYPLNILKVQSESSKISNLGQIFIFTENCAPNYLYIYFTTWQSKAWETGRPDISYINDDSFSRWIIEKSDGLTKVGLEKLSETVRDYAYLIQTSQTTSRWSYSKKLRCSTNI